MSGATWTSQDTMNLRRLLMKAQEQGIPITELAAEVEDPSLATSWDFLDGEQLEAGYTPGAMTDATKRRHEAMTSAPSDPQLPITGRPVPTTVVRAMSATPFPTESIGTPVPQTPVPDGIDLTMWGDTLIDFGKYKEANRSYAELAMTTTPRGANYRNWVLTHTRPSSSGELIDLYNYLKQVTPGQSNLLIPGTSKARVFK